MYIDTVIKLVLITVAAYATIGVNGLQSVTPTNPGSGDNDTGFTGDNYVALGRNIIAPESLSQFSRPECMSKE